MRNNKLKYFYPAVGIFFVCVVLIFYLPKFIQNHDHSVDFLTEWQSLDADREAYKFSLPHKLYQFNTLPFDTGFLSHLGAVLVITLEAISFIMYLNSQSRKQQKVVEENKSLQIQMLTSQIRPHFILNTIGAIRTLIFEDAERASDLLYSFSKYIRNNLEQRDYTKPVPFPEELDYVETYLSLESARIRRAQQGRIRSA